MSHHHDGSAGLSMAPSEHATVSPLKLMGLGLSAMLIPLGSTMIAVALPAIGSEFSRTPGDLTQWLVNSYLMINIIALGPSGKLGDHWGYRRTLTLGQWLFGVACLLPIVWHHFYALVAARVLMALGGAMMVPTVMAVIKLAVPAEKRHRVFGYFGGMMGLAAAVGPSLGGVLVDRFGWSAIFLMNLPPLLLSMVLSAGFFRHALHESPPAGFRFDWLGTALMAAALVCLVVGLRSEHAVLLPAAIFFVAFIGWQRRTPEPLIDLRMFSDRSFSAGCAIVALQNLSMYALLFQLPYLLKLLYDWGPQQSGHYMTTFMFSMMAASLLGGRIAEAIGVRTTCVGGALVAACGVGWLSLLNPGQNSIHVIAGLVLGGTGLGLANGPSQSAALSGVERNKSGLASGVMSTCRYLGGVVGVSILAMLLSAPASAQSLAQYHLAIQVFAGSFLIAAVVAMALPQHPKHV